MKRRKNDNVTTRSYKFRADPTGQQREIFARAFGCARWMWNRLLGDHNELYRQIGKVPFNTPKDYKDLDECKWLNDVDSLVLSNVQVYFYRAMDNFFKGVAGHPNFHKKKNRQSFTTSLSNKSQPNLYLADECHVKLPKVKEPLAFVAHRKIMAGGVLKNATVSMEPDGTYYVSMTFEYPKEAKMDTPIDENRAVGLDMKLDGLYVSSDGGSACMPRFYRDSQVLLAREQAKLSMRKKGSHRYEKQRRKIAKLHAKIKHQRSDFLYKTAVALVRSYDIICIEDLDLVEMAKARTADEKRSGKQSHGKAVSDVSWGEFVRILEWECQKHGKVLIRVDRYYPSSQTCHICGHRQKMPEDVRTYKCGCCGNVIDRDVQAAINIKKEGLRIWRSMALAA